MWLNGLGTTSCTHIYIVTELSRLDMWISALATASCSAARRVAGPEPGNEAHALCVELASNPRFLFQTFSRSFVEKSFLQLWKKDRQNPERKAWVRASRLVLTIFTAAPLIFDNWILEVKVRSRG